MTYPEWMSLCDRLLALEGEGIMTDDVPTFDWRESFEWGETPREAVRGAIHVWGVQDDEGTIQ